MKTYFMTMIDGTDDWVVYEPDYTIIDSRATRGMDSAMDFSRVMSGNGTAYSTYVLSAHPDTIKDVAAAMREQLKNR